MTPIAPDLHESYGVLMVASVVLLLLTPTTKHFASPQDRGRYYTMQAITALGAAIGAKLGVLFGDIHGLVPGLEAALGDIANHAAKA